jgi:hypothetical protein
MKFQNTFTSREQRYALGVELESGRRFASIPVANRMADYNEIYRISDDEYELFLESPSLALESIESCRRREQDYRLYFLPGHDRGTPS